MMHMPTKYEVSMLNRSIDIEVVPKSPYLLQNLHCACTLSRDT